MSVQHQQSNHLFSFLTDSLDVETRISLLLATLTLEEKIACLSTEPGIPRLGIRGLTHVEGLHGLAQDGEANWLPDRRVQTTIFPQAYGLGHTWSPSLIQKVAAQQAKECRYLWHHPDFRQGGLIVLAPNADLGRDPRWGRTEECYGEDAFLVGELVQAFVSGLQGDGPTWTTASLMKHFLANSHENDRERTSSDFNERQWNEYYAYPFRKGIEAGSRAYMASYNAINGVPSHVHPMHREVVRDRWGFDGFVCTDGGALGLLQTHHKFSNSLAECAAAVVKSGIVRFLDDYELAVKEALDQGLLNESDLDEVLRGFFRVADKLGELKPSEEEPVLEEAPWRSTKATELARAVTASSIVLLKNDGILPLADKRQRIAVIGEHANHVLIDWYSGRSPYQITPFEGIRERFSTSEVLTETNPDLALELAKTADIVIVCVGNQPIGSLGWAKVRSKTEGKESVDRESLELDDEPWVRKVHQANPNTVLVLISSFPYSINWSQENLPAIIYSVHSSQELGNGLADILSGDVNPAARLTQTWPRSVKDLPPMMDYDITKGRTYSYSTDEPLYPFGFGLSYSRFVYEHLEVLDQGDLLTVKVQVSNESDLDGEEVVQIYAKYLDSSVIRPNLQLVGFTRTQIQAGSSVEVSIRVAKDQFSYWSEGESKWVLEPGTVVLFAGPNSSDLQLSRTVNLGESQ